MTLDMERGPRQALETTGSFAGKSTRDSTSGEAIPYAPDAEIAALAGILNHPPTAGDVLGAVSPADFYQPRVRDAMEAVEGAVRDGIPPEPVTVGMRVGPDGFTTADLIALAYDAPTDAGALAAARLVARKATERRVLAESLELQRAVTTGKLDEVLPGVVERLGGVRLVSDGPAWSKHTKDGAAFVLDSPSDVVPVWGSGDQILWAAGEPFILCGPTGVGKTTLALQVLAGQLGVLPEVLGYPVRRAERVLYLACDRPLQIRRAMRRLFRDEDRHALEERLVVWQGPLPADLGKSPQTLLEICEHFRADAVWIDSLKDAVTKLTDDEAGGNYNRAVQAVVAAGIEVAALHHQRKGQGGAKPNSLEDVYGSTWLTAGAGSVVLLWGAAGDPLVEFRHLKQAAAELGPLRVEHDHLSGLSTIYRGVADPLVILRNRPDGIDATGLARLMFETEQPGDTQRKKAERALERLVRDGHAVPGERFRRDDGTHAGRRYFLAAIRELEAV